MWSWQEREKRDGSEDIRMAQVGEGGCVRGASENPKAGLKVRDSSSSVSQAPDIDRCAGSVQVSCPSTFLQGFRGQSSGLDHRQCACTTQGNVVQGDGVAPW